MIKLNGNALYLATLEREHCRKLFEEFEYDFNAKTEMLHMGHSFERSDNWYNEIQELQGNKHVRLGIFLNNDTVIGDVALQDIDNINRSCSIGYGLAKLKYYNKGYVTEAVKLMLEYGFKNIGMERIFAHTLEQNIGSQRVLEKCGFVLEGRERKAEYFGGKRYDRLIYGLLSGEYK